MCHVYTHARRRPAAACPSRLIRTGLPESFDPARSFCASAPPPPLPARPSLAHHRPARPKALKGLESKLQVSGCACLPAGPGAKPVRLVRKALRGGQSGGFVVDEGQHLPGPSRANRGPSRARLRADATPSENGKAGAKAARWLRVADKLAGCSP